MTVLHDCSDEDLIQRLRKRDPEALETLISRYSRELFYFIRIVLDGVGTTQDTEECVNDLFVTVWQEIDTFDTVRGSLRTWLTMRAKYIALDRRRQLCRRQTHMVQSADEIKQWHSDNSNGSCNFEYEQKVRLLARQETSMEFFVRAE